jgi:hypothetical protein
MSIRWQVPRRTFLKGLGATIALPLLDAMAPLKTLAGTASTTTRPLRFGVMFVPNGAHMQDWTPLTEGVDFELPHILKPLQPVKSDILVLTGLTQDKGRPNGDGPGDHARSASSFLTGAQPLKSEGASIRVGMSIDQYIAKTVGQETRFPSLELGTEKGRQAGKCDSGYSCAYSNNIAWRDESTPMAKEINPRAVFERLFGNDLPREMDESRARRERYKKSILDFVLEDAKRLSQQVGGNDKQKLDEYLTAVREIETRIERAERLALQRPTAISDVPQPTGIPDSFEEHVRLMGDMMVLAFQADVTRVCTYMIANEGSNRSYPTIGVNEGHHELSHHQGRAEKQAGIRAINTFHVAQLSYILQRLKSIPEGEGTLLDNCMILYGSGISDGNRHNHEDLPLLLAGRGGGTILTGRHVRYQNETPMCNLFLTLIERMGIKSDSFGDSTGHLRGLEG